MNIYRIDPPEMDEGPACRYCRVQPEGQCDCFCWECLAVLVEGETCRCLENFPEVKEDEMTTRVELGCKGHFIGAPNCHWRRHTQVGRYRVSTVGDYVPLPDGERREVGYSPDGSAYFETMVFETSDEPAKGSEDCGCKAVTSWSEIDVERYATAAEAQAGHERYVEKYAAVQDEGHR